MNFSRRNGGFLTTQEFHENSFTIYVIRKIGKKHGKARDSFEPYTKLKIRNFRIREKRRNKGILLNLKEPRKKELSKNSKKEMCEKHHDSNTLEADLESDLETRTCHGRITRTHSDPRNKAPEASQARPAY